MRSHSLSNAILSGSSLSYGYPQHIDLDNAKEQTYTCFECGAYITAENDFTCQNCGQEHDLTRLVRDKLYQEYE